MVYHYKVNQELIPTVASIPDVLFLLEEINTAFGTWHVATEGE